MAQLGGNLRETKEKRRGILQGLENRLTGGGDGTGYAMNWKFRNFTLG